MLSVFLRTSSCAALYSLFPSQRLIFFSTWSVCHICSAGLVHHERIFSMGFETLFPFVLVCAVSDVRTHRIPNTLILCGLAGALLSRGFLLLQGASPAVVLADGLAGFLLPWLLFGPLVQTAKSLICRIRWFPFRSAEMTRSGICTRISGRCSLVSSITW